MAMCADSRDSKLTQILQPSLAGTAKVAVICTFNPASNFIEESKSTLKFATRVKKVTVAAERNEVLDDKALLTKYRNQVGEGAPNEYESKCAD